MTCLDNPGMRRNCGSALISEISSPTGPRPARIWPSIAVALVGNSGGAGDELAASVGETLAAGLVLAVGDTIGADRPKLSSSCLRLRPNILLSSSPGSLSRRVPPRGPEVNDPADELIVATARIRGCSLLTADERILQYPHVKILN